MENNNFDFDLDAILAEFNEDTTEDLSAHFKQPEPEIPQRDDSDFLAYYYKEERKEKQPSPSYDEKYGREKSEIKKTKASPAKKGKKDYYDYDSRADEIKKQPKSYDSERPTSKRGGGQRVRENGLLKAVSTLAFLLMLLWGLGNIHPGASKANMVLETPQVQPAEEIPENSETPEQIVQEESPEMSAEPTATPEPTPEPKKVYTIEKGATVAPRANPINFGTIPIESASQMNDIIEQARELGILGEDEKLIFDPETEFNNGSYKVDISYYLDEATFVIAWKELVDGNTVSCVETKLADASQFRRKFSGDAYGSPTDYLSNLYKSTNAVVAMNADFYQFRDYGVAVYDGVLYKATDKRYLVHNDIDYRFYNCLDNCYVTYDGDLIFTYFGQEFTWDSLQQFITDNNINFSLSFGPILVDNYEVKDHYVGWYPVGEVDDQYSRAGFGQVDDLHYLYMSLNHSQEKSARWTMKEFADFFGSKGVKNAYAFDGGQTSEIIFNGNIFNYVDRGTERWVSDMIYFATAIPEEVWNTGA